MRIPTVNQWKYEKLAESITEILKRNNDWLTNEQITDLLLNAFDKIYDMDRAKESDTPILITDLSNIPEIFEHAKDRWSQGKCH